MSFKSRLVNIFDFAREFISSIPVKIKFSKIGSSSFVIASSPEAYLIPIYTRIAVDVASQRFTHALVDQNHTVLEALPTSLNYCLSEEPNFDQTAFTFFLQLIMTMMREGIAVVVPVDFELAPNGAFSEIGSLRIGTLTHEDVTEVKVDLYNDETGLKEQITLSKTMCAIIENPLRDVMGANNATLKRLLDKINLLDTSDRKNNSGKLDMVIQLPYAVKTTTRKELIDKRMLELEEQLSKSDLGIAYTEATEKIVQLNRTVGGNLMAEITDLTTRLHNQLGITESFMVGEAGPDEIRNYFSRTITPITRSITESLSRTFIDKKKRIPTDSGRTDIKRMVRERIIAERDVFELIGVMEIIGFADALTRNEIVSPTEVRAKLGMYPTGNPDADVVRNRNMPIEDMPVNTETPEESPV